MKRLIKSLYWDFATRNGRNWLISQFISDIPGDFGMELRRIWYSKQFRTAGVNLKVFPGTMIINPQNMECGDNVYIGYHNYLQAGGGLVISSDAMLGPHVKIWTQNHKFEDPNIPVHMQGFSNDPVSIGRDAWIGASVFIMPGTKIGDRCVISACSVVGKKNYPAGIVLAGNPARKIGVRGLPGSTPEMNSPSQD
jgi:acetyltransferase-like isoleucine patch superfamily enzyme